MKKNIFFTILLIIITASSYAQLVQKANKLHVGTTSGTMNTSAALDVTSTTKGFLPPRMTLTQMNAINSPATGLMVYCTDCTTEGLYVNNGSNFIPLAGAEGMVINRVAITALTNNGGSNYTITDSNTPATGAILITYEDAGGNVISTTVNSRTANTSFNVDFGAIPDNAGFLNYAFPTNNVATVTGTVGPAGAKGDKGDQGNAGVAGVKGDKGDQGDAGLATATNGLTLTGSNVKLGGTLIENTLITQGANTLDFTTTAVDGFAVDGTTFSVDGSNDRVGVGTALPEAKLEVNGAVKIGNNTGNAVVGMIRYNGTNYQGCTVAGNPGTWVDLDTSTSNSVTPITSITAATTLDTTHSTVIINTGSPVITLPTASANVGRIYRIVNRTTNTGTISTYRTITDASAISTTYVPNKVLLLQSDGTDWFQIN